MATQKPKIQIAGELREMTDEEFAQYEIDQQLAIAQKEEQNAKITEKNQLLQKLGITEAEAKLLLS